MILGAPPVSISEGNVNSVSEILGVVRVEFFEPVFPFSRDHGFTGIRAKIFSPQGGEKTRKPVQKTPSKLWWRNDKIDSVGSFSWLTH